MNRDLVPIQNNRPKKETGDAHGTLRVWVIVQCIVKGGPALRASMFIVLGGIHKKIDFCESKFK